MKTVSVESDSWVCGDGCCSDYWIDIYLLDESGKILSYRENLRQWGYKENFEEEIKAYCIEEFELENEEFKWAF